MFQIQNYKLRGFQFHSKCGFTLVELVISISIFMVFIAIAGGSYVSLVRANRVANDTQKLYREVRHVFDTFAQEIREGKPDFDCIDPAALDVFCIENQRSETKHIFGVVKNAGQERNLYKFDESSKKILVRSQERASALLPWAGGSWESFTSENLPLEDLSFSFIPLKNPYDSSSASEDILQWQPAISIHLKTKNHVFRTTYTSRTYGKQSLYN